MGRSCRRVCCQRVSAWLPVVSLIAGLTFCAALQEAQAEPFKFTNIHIETNTSGCGMSVQMFFDTDGIAEISIEDPNGEVVFNSQTPAGMEDTHDQTEGFQERVEPPIIELENALGCDPSLDAISLEEFFAAWPAGRYQFKATSGVVDFEGEARLTHKVPAGPAITAPADGTVVPHDEPILIEWNKVTGSILPNLEPVQIVGYHVVVKDVTVPEPSGPLQPAAFDVDVSRNETSIVVPKQYLEPNRIYEFEVLSTERDANQTITEGGVFCTIPKTPADCELP